MRLYIKSGNGFGWNLWLPTALIKSRFVIKCIKKYGGADIAVLTNLSSATYKALKEYVKQNGHFVLLDVKSSDGEEVLLKI